MEEMNNHWKIEGICYWENEVSIDEDGCLWINVGWHLPLCDGNKMVSIQTLLAGSGYIYAEKFN